MRIKLGHLRRVIRESIGGMVMQGAVGSMWDDVAPGGKMVPAEPQLRSLDDGDEPCGGCGCNPCGCDGAAGADDGLGMMVVLRRPEAAPEGYGDDSDDMHSFEEPEGGLDPDDESWMGIDEGDDELPVEPVGPAGSTGGAPAWAVKGS